MRSVYIGAMPCYASRQMRQDKPDRPRVLAPPPLIYLAPLVVGLALHFTFSRRFLPEGWAQLAVGLPVIVAGVALFATAVQTLRRAETDLRFAKPTTSIVSHGPYRVCRNPIYLAFTLVYIGIALAVNALWVLVLVPAAVVIVTLGAVLPEERFLERRFGQEYLRYKSKVRRWL